MDDWIVYHSKSQNIDCWHSKSRKVTYPAASKHQADLFKVGWVILPAKHNHPLTKKPQFLNVKTGKMCWDLSELVGYVPRTTNETHPQVAPLPSAAPAVPPPSLPSTNATTIATATTTTALGKRSRTTDEDDQRKAAEHYNKLTRNIEDRNKGSAAKMRKRHNWIKNVLLGQTISQVNTSSSSSSSTPNTISVLELSCGKGGDFFKIKNACPKGSTLNYVGVDIAQVSLEEVVKRTSEKSRSRGGAKGAATTNIRLSCVNLGTDSMMGHAASHLSSWSKERGWHTGPAFQSTDTFDVVTMQFALHYMFQSAERLKQFFTSWSSQLKEGGRFVATTMDSGVVLEHTFQHPQANPVTICDAQSRPCCSMLFDESVHRTLMNDVGYNSTFQLRYEITLTEYDDSKGMSTPYNYVEAPEWVVILSTLVDYAWRYGNLFLETNESLNFHHYFQKYSKNTQYNQLLSKMGVIDGNNSGGGGKSGGRGKRGGRRGNSSSSSSSSSSNSSNNNNNGGPAFTKIEWDLTRLYRTLSFVKGNGGRRVGIIVPFRDEHASQKRSEHLAQFMSYMVGYMSRSMVPYHIYIIEQSANDGKKFNRGKLLNVGYQIAQKEGQCTAFIFHDVDLLPSQELLPHYRCQEPELELVPNHIARVWNRYNANPNYIGGVTAYSKTCFEQLNGYPNNFWGWGGEDDELCNRMKACKQKFRSPKKGTLTDLENMTLDEKLNFLKEQNIDQNGVKGSDNHWKCMVKTDVLKEHAQTWRSNGLRDSTGKESVLYDGRTDVVHPSTYSTKITVQLTNNGDKYDTITSWNDL
jgi:SAM-dependent methyltransferase